MLSHRLGHFLDKPLARVVSRIPLSPNQITLLGLFLTGLSGIVIAYSPRAGAVLVMAGGFLDMLDGVVARTQNRKTRFGAFLDSVMDRYSDAFLFVGTAAFCIRTGDPSGALLSLGCLTGAYVTSYARARAEGLDVECRVGIMERAERVILLVIGLVTGWLIPSLWLIFLLSNATAFQRILFVRSALSGEAEGDTLSGPDHE